MPIPNDWLHTAQQALAAYDPFDWEPLFQKFIVVEQAASWSDFLNWTADLSGTWCFRGQREASWLLTTSLDRAVKRERRTTNTYSMDHLPREPVLNELLFRFQQQAHLYINNLPAVDDLSSWLALMQHHGVPTRFLDWTKSSYVALYFAVEEESQEDHAAIWALNLDWLERRAYDTLQAKENVRPASNRPEDLAAYQNILLARTNTAVVVKIEPSRVDARMVAQQGFFLCKLYHEPTFSQILMSMMTDPQIDGLFLDPNNPDEPVLRKLEVPKQLRIPFVKKLREMNINRASLFPGLDGFGRSLGHEIEIMVKDT